MSKVVFILISLCCSFLLTANQAAKVEISRNSDDNVYQGQLECQDGFSVGVFENCWLRLLHSNKLVKDAQIFVNGGMPAHGHGLPTSPKMVWSEDKNVYLIQGLKFNMPGEWKLNFNVNATDAALKDQITMLFDIE